MFTQSTDSLSVSAIRKRNSLDYLDAIFSHYEQDNIVFPVADLTAAAPPGVTISRHIDVGDRTGWFSQTIEPRRSPIAAHISLSSGTTGVPKALLLSHDSLADVSGRLVDAMHMDGGVLEYVGVPVTFSFGFGRIRAVAAAGGCSFLPERGFRPEEFLTLLRDGRVNSLSAVPTLLRLILKEEEKFRDVGRQLRWLEIGSQAMSEMEKAALRDIFPNARIVQHYGLTEASRSTFLDVSAGHHLGSVGRPSGSVEVRVVEDDRIAIRGPNVAMGLVTGAGVIPIVNEEGWLVTNDVGHIDDGYVYFNGRADDLVNVGGVKVPAEAFENALLSRTSPRGDVAVTYGADDLLGQRVVIASTAIEDTAAESDLWNAARAVAREFQLADSGVSLSLVSAIPRTETSKVRRRELEALAAPAVAVPPNNPAMSVRDVFIDLFGAAANDTSKSFVDLGGDSLSYVRARLSLESIIPDLPEAWEAIAIDDLDNAAVSQAASGTSPLVRRSEARLANLDTLRGLACIMIVAVHVVGVSATEGLELGLDSPWHVVMRNLEFIRLPLFTILAGIFYAAMPASRLGWVGFMRRKLEQFLPPLIFATLAFWVLRRLVYGLDEDLVHAFVDGYLHLWYLDSLLLIFAIAAAADLLDRRLPGALLASAGLVAIIYFIVPKVDILHLHNTLFLYPFFAAGIALYRYPSIVESRASLPLALLLTFAHPIAFNLVGTTFPGTLPDVLLGWLSGCAVAIVLLRLMPRIGALETISIFSFTIYLWHPAASALARTALQFTGIQTVWLLFVVCLAAGVIVPIGLHRFADRLPAAGRLLKG
jgi:acyl-coenzyme A synthetase/AMP-(fatty) acid ligase/surface polysaccharide O-acyltransferase-like enzyme